MRSAAADLRAERLIRWLLLGCLLSPLLCTCAAVRRTYPAETSTPTRFTASPTK